VLLVGPPGVGKGLVLKQVNELLKWHKKTQGTLEAAQNIQELKRKAQSDGNIDPAVVVQLAQAEQAMRDIADSGGASKEKSKQNFLFPVAPESITYEALVSLNARLSSTVKGISPQSMAPSGIYIHHSLCFILEEMSSLFRKHTESLVNYLLISYDCGDYTYATKVSGTDYVKKCCLSLLCGTTPSFIKSTFDDRLLTDGFSARVWGIYGVKNRFEQFIIPDFTTDQLVAREQILMRIKELSTLFGQVTYSPEAREYLRAYVEEQLPVKRVNDDGKLDPYYSRMSQHVMKLSLIMHFCDSDKMVIELETAVKCVAFLQHIEVKMHLCFATIGKNELSGLASKILKYIERQDNMVTFMDIYGKFFEEAKRADLEESIEFLLGVEKLKIVQLKDSTMRYGVNGRKYN
jgi:hypothetical protein